MAQGQIKPFAWFCRTCGERMSFTFLSSCKGNRKNTTSWHMKIIEIQFPCLWTVFLKHSHIYAVLCYDNSDWVDVTETICTINFTQYIHFYFYTFIIFLASVVWVSCQYFYSFKNSLDCLCLHTLPWYNYKVSLLKSVKRTENFIRIYLNLMINLLSLSIFIPLIFPSKKIVSYHLFRLYFVSFSKIMWFSSIKNLSFYIYSNIF